MPIQRSWVLWTETKQSSGTGRAGADVQGDSRSCDQPSLEEVTRKQTREEVKEQVIHFTCGAPLTLSKQQVQTPYWVHASGQKAGAPRVEETEEDEKVQELTQRVF